MAAKKKARPKAKTRKAPAKKRAVPKKVVAVKKKPPKKQLKKQLKKQPKKQPKKMARAAVKAPAVRRPPAAPASTPPVPPTGEERVGIVTHYYSQLSVAIVQMESGTLRVGDSVHIHGHTSDFRQHVESMEVDHVHVPQVGAGQVFGLRVAEHVREHDVVYKTAG